MSCECGRVRPGRPYDGRRDCFVCWVRVHRPHAVGSTAAAVPVRPVARPNAAARKPAAALPVCEFEGPVREYCKTCGAKEGRHVRTCYHEANPTETCTRAVVSPAAWACATCPHHTGRPAPPARLVEVPQAGLARGDTGAINASLLRHAGRLLMAYRAGVGGATVHVAELAEDYTPVRSVPLALPHPAGPTSQEDPRLTTVRGRLRVWFYGYDRAGSRTTMLYADLADDLTAGPVRCPELHGRAWPKEKNWAPFEWDGEQYVVYTVSPHVVCRVEGDRAERVHVADTPFPWAGGHLRGGAPPVRVGDRYYHWFHGCADPRTGRPSDGTAAGSHYNVGLYTFEARPPFRPLAMTPAPLLWGDRHDNVTRDRCPYHAVAFPCGAILEGGVWKVSMGWNDRRIMVAEWDAAAADAALAARR